jgi:hypothetical protein
MPPAASPPPGAAAAVTPAQWHATFAEARVQALAWLRHERVALVSDGWVAVDAADAEAPGGAAEEAAAPGAWRQSEWAAACEVVFCAAPEGLRPEADDLLMFVRARGARAAGAPTFARRRGGAALPPELRPGGALAGEVDWRASWLLNLVLQTSYRLTALVCDLESVDERLDGAGAGAELHGGGGAVAREVHASAARVRVAPGGGRAAQATPAPSYPDACFTLFEEDLEALALVEPRDCFTVLLHADAARSWGSDGGGAAPRAGLFSGYASHAQVVAALGPRLEGSPLRQLLGGGGGAPRRVWMRGPGGVGGAEVAVSPAPRAVAGGASPMGLFLRRRGAARGSAAPPRLECALETLAVPVGALAEGILAAL